MYQINPTGETADRFLRSTDKKTIKKPLHKISLMDRWIVVGMTGTGKTTFVRKLLHVLGTHYPDVATYILDSKQAGDFRGWPGAVFSREAPDPIAYGMQIWQPPLDDTKEYNNWLGKIHFAREPCIILIDELSSLSAGFATNRVNYPQNYSILAKQGRGLHQCLISLTQEIAYIPRQALGQATHIIRFALVDDHDSRVIDRKLRRIKAGDKAMDMNPKHKHGFYYGRIDEPPVTAWYYETYNDFF